MNGRFYISIALAVVLQPLMAVDGEEISVERVFIKRIQEVQIPARKSGVLKSLIVREGSVVSQGQTLAQLDDRQAAIDLQHAKTALKVASFKADDSSSLELAKKKLEKETKALKQTILENQAARRAAENELRIQAAEKARDVSKNELDRALRARKEFVDAVSQSEIDGLRLAYERAELDAKQAKFEQQQQEISAEASDEAVNLQELSIQQSMIEVKQSESELYVAQLDTELQTHAVESANLNVRQHQIDSSIDGVVVELFRQEGEWLKPGDPVMRILRLNRLRAEGFIPLSLASPDLVGSQATILITGVSDPPISVKGELTFVSPQVDAVNQEVQVYAEFDNPDFQIRPGMQGAMTIVVSE